MSALEAILLGLLQGLTEFLPVSSSGHLAIGKALFGIETSDLSFEVAVHAATVLATIVVFRKDIWKLLCGLFKWQYNSETRYILLILLSMVPVFIVGVFFKDSVEALFGNGLVVVGVALLVTALLFALALLIPALLVFLVLFMGPMNAYYSRYMLPLTAFLPFLAFMVRALGKEPGADPGGSGRRGKETAGQAVIFGGE